MIMLTEAILNNKQKNDGLNSLPSRVLRFSEGKTKIKRCDVKFSYLIGNTLQ